MDLDGVSRETRERLQVYFELLKKWNPRINLVSKSTLSQAVERHFQDSLQVIGLQDQTSGHWVDLGSGGGFPGLVAAIAAKDDAPDMKFTLIESDQRKCAFLRTVLRETDTKANVITQRIEAVDPQEANVLSARALAELPKLLEFTRRHRLPNGVALFPKGASWEKEVQKAQESWSFKMEVHTSKLSPDSVVLKIGEIARV